MPAHLTDIKKIKKPVKPKSAVRSVIRPKPTGMDGLGAGKKIKPAYKRAKPQSIKKRAVPAPIILTDYPPIAPKKPHLFFFHRYKVAVLACLVLLLAVYASGFWTAISTSKSFAEFVYTNPSPKPAVSTLVVAPVRGLGQLPIYNNQDDLFAMPLNQLESVFAQKRVQAQKQAEAEIIKIRTAQIRDYLISKKSPFADYAGIIAQQSHWQLILAISFAESSWGRNCTDNNCSNIGVKPGHEMWHEYDTYGDWIVDFNKLLDRRYKDWTLDDMCGVYVKPCNRNWLLATRQVLEELKSDNIE